MLWFKHKTTGEVRKWETPPPPEHWHPHTPEPDEDDTLATVATVAAVESLVEGVSSAPDISTPDFDPGGGSGGGGGASGDWAGSSDT
jgi:uncharacterized membrane protein YgcG